MYIDWFIIGVKRHLQYYCAIFYGQFVLVEEAALPGQNKELSVGTENVYIRIHVWS